MDLSNLQRIPEGLFALKEVACDMSTCFQCTEINATPMRECSGDLEMHLYNMVVKLSDVIRFDLIVHGVENGTLDTHEQVDRALQDFTRSTQILLKNVLQSSGRWNEAEIMVQRIKSWESTWHSLANLFVHLLKAELLLAKQCFLSKGVCKSDILDAQFSHYQIMTHREDAWKWGQTQNELKFAASKDKRASEIVSRIRIRRVVDRLKTSSMVSEEIIAEMWRKEAEQEDDEVSMHIKQTLAVAISCLNQNVEKLKKYISTTIE